MGHRSASGDASGSGCCRSSRRDDFDSGTGDQPLACPLTPAWRHPPASARLTSARSLARLDWFHRCVATWEEGRLVAIVPANPIGEPGGAGDDVNDFAPPL